MNNSKLKIAAVLFTIALGVWVYRAANDAAERLSSRNVEIENLLGDINGAE